MNLHLIDLHKQVPHTPTKLVCIHSEKAKDKCCVGWRLKKQIYICIVFCEKRNSLIIQSWLLKTSADISASVGRPPANYVSKKIRKSRKTKGLSKITKFFVSLNLLCASICSLISPLENHKAEHRADQNPLFSLWWRQWRRKSFDARYRYCNWQLSGVQ